ncbi:MAG: hypothetical protein R2880_19465 [Deinococcales bacterium]
MFLNILGHEAILDFLPKLSAHSLLFCGPDGVGRRLVARWYAAFLNCQAVEKRPCGQCNSCQQILNAQHPDYREISPEMTTKSGRKSRQPQFRIDDLVPREGGNPEPLSPWLRQRPYYRCRLAVIDHAEGLNDSAANAFLKVLEEPPSYVKIVLIAP